MFSPLNHCITNTRGATAQVIQSHQLLAGGICLR